MSQIEGSQFAGWGASPLTLREAVIERLRDAIIGGILKPGELLRDTTLANRLGVSATPIREALGDLAAEGLIEIEARRLKRVTPIDSKAMADLFLVQGELWRLGYVWGMPKVGRPEMSELEAAIGRYRVALSNDDALGAIRAGHAFHTVFITASGNGELLRSTLDRRSLIARFILLHGRETLSENGLQLHEDMLGALRDGAYPDVLSHLDRMTRRLFQLATAAGSTVMFESKKVA